MASVLQAGLAATLPDSNAAPVASRIVGKIDEAHLVALQHTVHPLANAKNDRGAAPDGMKLDRMHLVLSRSSSQETALRQLITDMHTPGTSSYHQWLTPEQFGKQFGPSDEDIAAVETWLGQHGFSVTKVNPGRQTIEFSGSVGQLRSAFHTQIRKYEVNGESHYANATDPKIPAALAPVVGGFVTLNNFHAKSHAKVLGKASYNPRTDKAAPEWTVGSNAEGYSFVLSPADYAVQYDLNPLYKVGTNGSGQTIAIINEANINIAQVNNFRTLFGLPANPPQVIIDGNDPGIDGINNPDGPNGASVEAYLDVEWAGAVAPNATVDLVIGGDTALESGLFLAAEHAVYSNLAPIMSLSFGECEADLGSTNNFLETLWEQAAAQGITVLVSSGDNGSAGCDNDNTEEFASYGQAVSGFASTPFNVAVGGTDFYYSDFSGGLSALEGQFSNYWSLTPSNSTPAVSIKGVIPEQPWNDSQYGLTLATLENGSSPAQTSIAGGSGGASSFYLTKPAWQSGKGVPNDLVRDIPDVSLFASSGANASYYPICADDGDCQPAASGGTVQVLGVGGTSASTPSFAGMMALVNQKYGRQGQADFVLYPLATQVPAAFHDVTVGTNTEPCDITDNTTDCIKVSNPVTVGVSDGQGGTVDITEGEIGTGTTAEYNATVGYDLASGLGTIDANQLVTNWGSVKLAASTTTLTPSQTTFTHGSAVTVSGTVTSASGTPTGDVSLMTSNTDLGQQAPTFFSLADGAFTKTFNSLPAGTYNIWGRYGGDSTTAASTSTPVQVTVTPEGSTLNFTLYSSLLGTFTAPASVGTSVDYGTQLLLGGQPVPNSSVSGEPGTIPTGTVTFKDGTTTLNTAVLNVEGDAEYNEPFAIGTHSVTATYSGDQSYSTSSAPAITFTVTKDTPVVLVGASNQVSQTGYIGGQNQPTVLNIQVENYSMYISGSEGFDSSAQVAAPTGTVTITGLPSGVPTSATLVAAVDPATGGREGIATFSIPARTGGGNYTANISYAGDANYGAATASTVVTVQAPTGGLVSSTAATVTGNTISPTTNIVINGTVTGQSGHAAPTGGVLVYSSGYFITEVALNPPASGDVASFSLVLNSQSLFQGANFITLQYTGDNTYYPSAISLPSPNPVQNPLSDFSMVAQTTIAPVAAPGDSITVPVNISSMNGFKGAVALTVSTDAQVGAQIPASVTLAAGGSQLVNLVLTSGVNAGSGTFNVRITGVDSTGKFVHTIGLQLVVGGNVAPTQSFTLTNSGNITIAEGVNSGNTATVTLTPVNGFSAAVALTCAVTGPAGATSVPTCNLQTASLTGSGTDTLTVDTTSTTTLGTYKVTVTGVSGSLTETTSLNVVVSADPTFALTNSGNITMAAGATTGNTSTITVTPANGFASAVALTCAVSSPAGATSPATCALASATVAGGTGTDVLTITTTSSTTAGTYTITVTGTAGSLTETTVVTATVTADPTFTLALSPTTISVSAGATTGNTSTITVTPMNGFTGAVNLSCSVTSSPTGATDLPTCSVPASVTIGGASPSTAMVTISTTAPTSALNKPAKFFWPSAGGTALALVCLLGIPARRRRNWMAMLGLVVFFASIAAIGCGGGGGSGGGGGGGSNTGTTAGNYTITVTGSGAGATGTITQTAPVTLTVQ